MDFRDSPSEQAFRQEVRRFIAEELPTAAQSRGSSSAGRLDGRGNPALQRWRNALAMRGWIAPHWPHEYGGAGMTVTEQFIFNEEMAEARAPMFGGSGVATLGPALILYGTEEQKREHLPGIASGEVLFCQGASEPGAGSDLASLTTSAVRDGDDYIVNGQKIWTSLAHEADWMFMLVRTDSDAPKHRGISMLLVDLKSPGISIHPLIDMAGSHEFNQEYLDDVRVPVRNRVGEENRGWYVAMAALESERSNVARAIALRHDVNDFVELARSRSEQRSAGGLPNGSLRMELAERALEAEIGRLICYRIISLQKRGESTTYEASMNKLYRSELAQRIAQTGMKVIGLFGNAFGDDPHAPLKGRLSMMYLQSVSTTIAGGTSEIQRNVMATRGLGLPRD